MAKKGGAKKDSKKKPAEKKKKVTRKLYTMYLVEGDKIIKKNKSCPKCGPGFFLGNHKDRIVCGKCGYSEFNSAGTKN